MNQLNVPEGLYSAYSSSQPRSNDPCVDPCVVLGLTLPLFPILYNQSIVCLLYSRPLFRSFASHLVLSRLHTLVCSLSVSLPTEHVSILM